MLSFKWSAISMLSVCFLSACGGGGSGTTEQANNTAVFSAASSAVDAQLQILIADQGLSGDASSGRSLPNIADPLPQLGKLLFFSKSLGGNFDAACVSCHHPTLGGADDLSLPIGVDATSVDQLGIGRVHTSGEPIVARNSPTIFNVGLNDHSMFWDSRVESLGKEVNSNGALSGIRTPDSALGVADANAGDNLVEAQARFPVTSIEEMKTSAFENGSSGDVIRTHLAARIGDYGVGSGELLPNTWLHEFQTAFSSTQTASDLITFDNIAKAIGEYQRSMVFVNNPWRDYVNGNTSALTDDQKQGAILFFTSTNQGGGGCSGCHSGDFFTDGQHHIIAFPQIGPGLGDGSNNDFGRERQTIDDADRFRFRTPSLLNVAQTAPYGHSGSYGTLEDVLSHYNNPRRTVNNYFNDGGWCQLAQFSGLANCATLYPDAEDNTDDAVDALRVEQNNNTTLFDNINLNAQERSQIIAFLSALTDPCVIDRDCLSPWIADPTTTGPDGNQLNAIDAGGGLL